MADKGKGAGDYDLGEIIKQARNRPMNVALVLGKEGLDIAGDARKGVEAMWRDAKAMGGGSKGGMGVLNVIGKELHVQFVAEDYPASLKKAFKDKLRDAGLKFKPVFILPDGTVDGAGEEDEEGMEGDEAVAAAAPDAAAPEAGADPTEDLRRALLAEFEGLADALAGAKGASPLPAVKKIEGLEAMFQTEVERDPKKAGAVLSLLKKMAGDAPQGDGAPDPAGDARRASLASLEKGIDALLAEFA